MANPYNSLFDRCLTPLLRELGWDGDARSIRDFACEDIRDLLNNMAQLQFIGSLRRSRLSRLHKGSIPCLFIPDSSKIPVVIAKIENNRCFFYDSYNQAYRTSKLKHLKGTVAQFKKVESDEKTLDKKQTLWFAFMLKKFRNFLALGALISTAISVLAVVSPFLVMLVFGQIVAVESAHQLALIGVGVIIYLLSLIGFRTLRSFAMSYLGSRIGYIIASQVLRRIFLLPPSYTEMSSMGSQLKRIKDFESIQDFFSGQGAASLLELPFVVILIAVLFMLGGPIGFVPIAAGVIYITVGTIIKRLTKSKATTGESTKAKREFQMETFASTRDIRALRLGDRWLEKYRNISAQAALETHHGGFSGNLIGAFSYGIISTSGLATMALGVMRIIEEQMSAPELMGCILLSMRVLVPARTAFNMMSTVDRLKVSVKHIDTLMNLPIEVRNEVIGKSTQRKLEGHVAFTQVSLRYTQDSHPALLGCTFSVEPGQTVSITGHGGCGKTTILKLIMGMYFPQAGRITVDRLNTKQLEPTSLRRRIAYLPQKSFHFDGSIRQNFQAVNPAISDARIYSALAEAGMGRLIGNLRGGIDTQINSDLIRRLPGGFLRQLNFAMLFAKDAGLWLIDDPGAELDDQAERELLATLQALRGQQTMIIASQDHDYLAVADKVLWLNAGRVAAFGKPEEIVKRFQGAA